MRIDFLRVGTFFRRWLLEFIPAWAITAGIFIVMGLLFGIPKAVIKIPNMSWIVNEIAFAGVLASIFSLMFFLSQWIRTKRV